MRVGILTFHRANNYGAVLQCYALQESLRSLGHDAMVIDYRQPFVELVYEGFSWRYLLTLFVSRPQAIPIYLMGCDSRAKVRPLFAEFRNRFLKLTAECNNGCELPQNIDTYVIGSDQLWSNNCTNGRDLVYYGDFSRPYKSRVFGYAISSNTRSISKLNHNRLRLFSQNFVTLSLRESNICDMVAPYSESPVRVDIDPTLLLGVEKWSAITSPRWESRRYVLLYQLRTKKGRGAKLRRKAQELADNMGCELIDLSRGQYSVEDFVSLFRYAQYVVTSSFHGTVFSLIFQRPLYSVTLGDGHDGRCVNLLQSIGAESMLVALDKLETTPLPVDYTNVNRRIEELRSASLNYLRQL